MRRLVFVAVTVATTAFADLAPPNTFQCAGQAAGSPCTTDEGGPGTCVSSQVARNDYSQGVPPKVVMVDVLTCVASAPARALAPKLVSIAVLFALLAAFSVLRLWRSRPGAFA